MLHPQERIEVAEDAGDAAEEAGELRVDVNTEVTAVRPQPRGGFEVEVVPAGPAEGKKKKNKGAAKPTLLRSRYVIWAAGEFQYPRASAPLFPGSEPVSYTHLTLPTILLV